MVYAPGHDKPTTSTAEVGDLPISTLVPHAIPTEKTDGTQNIKRQIVDVNKPEIQM